MTLDYKQIIFGGYVVTLEVNDQVLWKEYRIQRVIHHYLRELFASRSLKDEFQDCGRAR